MAMVVTRIGQSIYRWLHPTLDALFSRNLPWQYRWRLLVLQPVIVLSNIIGTHRYWFRRKPYRVEYLAVAPNRSIRALVFGGRPEPSGDATALRPLHVCWHAGGFLSGMPENNGPWCERLADETGAVVIAPSYRKAPANVYPAAHEDADAVVAWLRAHARERFGADPDLMTTSGFSAGGTLALAVAQRDPAAVKAAVTFYAVCEFRIPPALKPMSGNMPKNDPMRVFLPLYDAYSASVRRENLENPHLNLVLASVDQFPTNMLMWIAGTDVLTHEQKSLMERLQQEAAADARHAGRRLESVIDETLFHGCFELPASVIGQDAVDRAFGRGIKFIQEAHQQYGGK